MSNAQHSCYRTFISFGRTVLLNLTREFVDLVSLIGVAGLALAYAPTSISQEDRSRCCLHHRRVSARFGHQKHSDPDEVRASAERVLKLGKGN